MNNLTFNEVMNKHAKTLELYVPIVAKVHGGTHPEFHEVKKFYDELTEKIKNAGEKTPELKDTFEALRKVTGDFSVPKDVCESYEAVYVMLAEISEAYTE